MRHRLTSRPGWLRLGARRRSGSTPRRASSPSPGRLPGGVRPVASPSCGRPASTSPLRGGSFDLVISEYGAAIWADPYAWIPEASRLPAAPRRARSSSGTAALLMLCVPDEDETPATARAPAARTSVCTASSGPTTRPSSSTSATATGSGCCAGNGFEILDLIELRAPRRRDVRVRLRRGVVGEPMAVRGGLARPGSAG